MTTSATQTEKLQYTPTGGSPQTFIYTIAGNHSARSEGTLAIVNGTGALTSQSLPPGPYKKLVIYNRVNGQNIEVTINGSAVCELPPGGEISIAMPTAPGALPLLSAAIANVGVQLTNAEVDFFVFD